MRVLDGLFVGVVLNHDRVEDRLAVVDKMNVIKSHSLPLLLFLLAPAKNAIGHHLFRFATNG